MMAQAPSRVRALFPVLVAMLVATLHAVERLAMALEARGFGGPATRTALRPLRMRPADWLALTLVLAATGCVLAARLGLGFGAQPLPALGPPAG
jgi:energy-coupling factor transporter transmembrane protein EcfT